MSQPKRYDHCDHCDCYGMLINNEGEWVKWDDYAALAAENERLRSKLSFSQSISEICKHTHEGETVTVQGSISSGKTILADLFEVDKLRAENERLRKAGDELEDDLFLRMNLNARLPSSIAAWNAAKEGRNAK